MTEDWLSDEIRGRSAVFWARRNAWPIETPEYILLASAMLRVGPAAHPGEWEGDEPRRAWMPILSRYYSRPLSTLGFDAVYAEALLANRNPSALTRPYDGRRNFAIEPLTNQEWAAAFDAYDLYERKSHAVAATMTRSVVRMMTVGFATGALISAVRKKGQFEAVPANYWNDETVAYPRFIESQMNLASPFEQNWPTLAEAVFQKDPPEMLIPGNEWIFVSVERLETFLAGIANRAPKERRRTVSYPQEKVDSTLAEIYADIEARKIAIPTRDGLIEILCQRLPGVSKDVVKRRHAAKRPAWWKSGPRSIH